LSTALARESPSAHPCGACGGEREELCTAQELSAQSERARRFHAARLVRSDPGEREERSSFTQSDAAGLTVCRGCRLVARDPLPDPRALARRYANDAYAASRLEEMRAAQVASFRRKLPQLRRLVGTPRRVLEIGSFVGGFLEVARTAGWWATGIDPGRQVTAACKARGLDVRACTLEEFDAVNVRSAVDCIAIWNTFDQLADPRPALDFARRWLRPGGVLALRVPHGLYYARSIRRWRGAAGGPRARFAEACLAWNNLLGFPYLYGYGIESLDRAVHPFGFVRAAAQGDVLCALAGRATADWARREERACKQLQRAWIALDARRARRRLAAAPWLDVYYRRDTEEAQELSSRSAFAGPCTTRP
jgi:SAM-dependent methyltransferase